MRGRGAERHEKSRQLISVDAAAIFADRPALVQSLLLIRDDCKKTGKRAVNDRLEKQFGLISGTNNRNLLSFVYLTIFSA